MKNRAARIRKRLSKHNRFNCPAQNTTNHQHARGIRLLEKFRRKHECATPRLVRRNNNNNKLIERASFEVENTHTRRAHTLSPMADNKENRFAPKMETDVAAVKLEPVVDVVLAADSKPPIGSKLAPETTLSCATASPTSRLALKAPPPPPFVSPNAGASSAAHDALCAAARDEKGALAQIAPGDDDED